MTDSEVTAIIELFYPADNDLRRTLLRHSSQVREKALAVFADLPEALRREMDPALISAGAMLHDVGICQCSAPDIFCTGSRHYLEHGIAGAEMLRRLGRPELEACARICECHTGSGLTAKEIRCGGLPLPVRDFLPETPEEKLVCFADKFYSKSGAMQEKSLEKIRCGMRRFGEEPLRRFDELCSFFYISPSFNGEVKR